MYEKIEFSNDGEFWEIGYLVSKSGKKINAIPLSLFSDDADEETLLEDCSMFKKHVSLEYTITTKTDAQSRKRELQYLTFTGVYIKKRIR